MRNDHGNASIVWHVTLKYMGALIAMQCTRTRTATVIVRSMRVQMTAAKNGIDCSNASKNVHARSLSHCCGHFATLCLKKQISQVKTVNFKGNS